MKDKLLYLTSANLATNPRLVKEIDALSNDYDIDVILFKFIHWSSENDAQMREKRNHISFILVDVSKANILKWFIFAVIEKFCQYLFPYFKWHLGIAAYSLSRKSFKLSQYLKKNHQYKLIIAHTLPALYPAFKAAQKWGIPFSFDIEDYDPGMSFSGAGKNYKEICETLYKNILPKAAFLTSASPLIGVYTLKLIGGHNKHFSIINSFPQNEFNYNNESNTLEVFHPLKFVWFSLTISFNRGLEQFIEAAADCNFNMELTLIGAMDPEFNSQIIQKAIQELNHIKFNIITPVSQQELHKQLFNHHIGISLENPMDDFNRELCLTNKILAYAQAGNFILASDTKAQKQFIDGNPEIGIVTSISNKERLIAALNKIYSDREKIINNHYNRYTYNKHIAIENQIPILKKLITETINTK